MKHSYDENCHCKRCDNERIRRSNFRAGDPRTFRAVSDYKPLARRRRRTNVASREEQNARYIDCGPQAWDDRD